MAAILQLAGLACCPMHRKRFFFSGGGADAFATYAEQEDIHRVGLTPRMAKVWHFHLGMSSCAGMSSVLYEYEAYRDADCRLKINP